MHQIKLSPDQQRVVGIKDGSYLILASAGSGKTRVLTERIKLLSDSANGKILAITFTNKAAAEIRERLGTTETITKNVFVGTFHSFCQSVLELRFKLLGYSKMPHIFEEEDRIELIKQAIKSVPYFNSIYYELEPRKRIEYTYNALHFISNVKRELLTAEELAKDVKNSEYLYLYETYQDILKSNNAIDFDDIIRLVYELFSNNESVANLYQKSYSYVCIDECQDLNKLQYLLLKSLCGNAIKNVMMVGDPNQAIYGFNGSASSYMLEDFLNDFGANVINLYENYRCSKSIIEASNMLMKLDVEAVNYVIPGIFEIYEAASENDEAQFVLNKIKELIELKSHPDIEGDITFDKISILGRNRFVFKQIVELLNSDQIPFYYKSGNAGIKFSSPSMRIFDLFFRGKINPLDKLHDQHLQDLLKVQNINSPDDLKSSNFSVAWQIKNALDDASIDNIHLRIDGLRRIFENENFEDDEKKLTIDELSDLSNQLVQYKKQNIKPSLVGFKSAMALGLTNNTTSKEFGICLSTVHTMKGQESEIVFLIGMDEGTFPDYRAINKGYKELQQEKNNAYVAFTRAKRFLFVSYPKKRLMPWGDFKARTISRFLKPFDH